MMNLKRRLEREHRFLLLAFVVLLCGYLFFSFYGEIKANLIEEFNKRQMVLARQAARGIEKLMAQHERTLKVLSRDRRIIEMDPEGRRVMATIFAAQSRDVRGVSRVDEHGHILYTVPDSIRTIGKDISHQPHVKEALTTHQPVVSDVFTAIQGFRTVAYHYPVFDGDRFAGTIAVLINFDHLSEDLLSGIKVGKTGTAWAIDEAGTEIYCTIPGHMGRSVIGLVHGRERAGSLAGEMMGGKTGTGFYAMHEAGGEGFAEIKKHVAYTPAKVGNRRWSIAVATPEEEILEGMILFRNKLFLVFAVLLAGSIVFSYYSFRARGILKEEEQRLRAEEALRESEEKYRAIFENSVEGIFQTTPDGRLLMANPALARMHGYESPEEMMTGIAHMEDLYVNPEIRGPYLRGLEEKGEVSNFEVELLRKDGSTFLASFSARALRDEHGKVVRYEGTAEDITEKRRTLEELREYQKAVEGSRDIIIVLDGSYRYRAVNQSYLDYRMMKREDVIGRQLEEIVGTDFFEKDVKGRLDSLFSGDVIQVEIKQTFPNMGERDFHVTFLPVLGDGQIDRAVLIMHDITDQKRAEEALRNSEEKYRSVVESSIIGFYIVQGGLFRFVNKGFCEIMGYSLDEIVDKLGPLFLTAPEDRPIVDENMRRRLSGEEKFIEYEFRSVRKDEKVINVKVLGGSMMYKGRPAATGTLIDITRERSLEAQLRQSQKMEAIGTLAGGVAHDFNNLLTVLMGYANLLQVSTDAASPSRTYADQIMAASQKAASLTRSLLAFSRKQPLALESHNINDLVMNAEKLFTRLLTEDIEVKTHLASEKMVVMADSTQIDQILFNLVANARDAMAEGGVLAIETRPIDLDQQFARIHGFDRPGPYALLSVSDTGTGMDEEMKEKIFDPFFTTKPVGKGTGIGLSTVYGIVKQHNGYIYVYSEPGVGTTFHIYLPLAKGPAREASNPAREVARGTERVLVAEDDRSVRSLLTAVLSGSGYTVIEAVDGEDAIDQFSKNDGIDLVILDSVMPRKNGRQAYNEINRKSPLVKVLFTSGYTRDVVLDKGIEARELDFISKPVSPLELLRKVREVLDR